MEEVIYLTKRERWEISRQAVARERDDVTYGLHEQDGVTTRAMFIGGVRVVPKELGDA